MGWLGNIVKGAVAGALILGTAGAIFPLLGLAAPAAGFLGISGAGILGISSATLAAAAFGAAIGGLNGIAAAIAPKPKAVSQDLAARIQITQSPNASRQIVYGKVGTAGQLIFKGYSGDDNEILHLILVVAGTEIDSLVSVTLNGKDITLPSTYPYGAITTGNFADKLSVYFHDGRSTGGIFSGGEVETLAPWNAKVRSLRGIAAVYLRAVIDDDFEGKMEPVFVVKGRKVYDARFDSSNGGTGLHRLNTPSTWTWSSNPIACTLDYIRGIYTDDVKVAGMTALESELDYSRLGTDADVCDQSVDLADGGTEARYSCDGIIDPKKSHRDNLNIFASSMAGRWSYTSKFNIRPGYFADPVMILDASYIIGVPSSYRRFPGKDNRVNAVRGVFADPGSNYQVQSYPTVTNADYVAADGETLYTDLDLPCTTSQSRAQRIATIAMNRNRAFRILSATFDHRCINLKPDDVVTFNYPPYGISDLTMIVGQWDLSVIQDKQGNSGIGVAMTISEEQETWYDWSVDTQLPFTPPDNLGSLLGRSLVAGLNWVHNADASGYDISGGSTGTVATATYNPISNSRIYAIATVNMYSDINCDGVVIAKGSAGIGGGPTFHLIGSGFPQTVTFTIKLEPDLGVLGPNFYLQVENDTGGTTIHVTSATLEIQERPYTGS